MPRIRRFTRAFVVPLAVVASAVAALAAEPAGTGGAYVVTFRGSVADAAAAIRAAGGTVVDVNAGIGVALVSAPDGTFPTAVRAYGVVTGVARNHSIGTVVPGMPHRWAEERPEVVGPPIAPPQAATARSAERAPADGADEPLSGLQWDMQMIGATAAGAHRRATGRTVLVGIIDTGVDASHPDIAPNFDAKRSRNFTVDQPSIDGPCEQPSCVDPVDVDDGGHGTHVAGIVAARRNDLGIAGVAPNAKIVNVRAGQDSGYFFLYETVAALTYAGDAGLDVVNMSFFTDPWLFNCDSADDDPFNVLTADQLAEQALTKQLVTDALEYAHAHGVTLVAAAGNEHVDLALPTRSGGAFTDDCKILPSEGPHVIQVAAVGPSTTKADYSNYGYPNVEISAPGGWFRDFFGTPQFRTSANLVLSSYPLHVAIADGLADANGDPTTDASVKGCNRKGTKCGFYTYLQGTSMAAPHVTGVVALIIEEHGKRVKGHRRLDPDTVRQILLSTATDHPCPVGGIEDYSDEDRPAEFNAVCDGTAAANGLYGEGIVNAAAAVE